MIIGAIGTKQHRDRAVCMTAVLPPANEVPPSFPSASQSGTPLPFHSSIRVNARLALLAIATAVYGTKMPNDWRALIEVTSLLPVRAILIEAVSARPYDWLSDTISTSLPDRLT